MHEAPKDPSYPIKKKEEGNFMSGQRRCLYQNHPIIISNATTVQSQNLRLSLKGKQLSLSAGGGEGGRYHQHLAINYQNVSNTFFPG